jgi:uncharacterized protein YbaR (Trm112 family)
MDAKLLEILVCPLCGPLLFHRESRSSCKPPLA